MSATESGIALIPLAMTTPGSLLSGQAMLHWKNYKRAPMIGLALSLISMAFLVWRPDMPLVYTIAVLGVVGPVVPGPAHGGRELDVGGVEAVEAAVGEHDLGVDAVPLMVPDWMCSKTG